MKNRSQEEIQLLKPRIEDFKKKYQQDPDNHSPNSQLAQTYSSTNRRILSSGAQIQPKKKIKGKSMLDANQARWFASTVSLQQDDKLPKLKPKEERTEGDDKDKLIRLLNQENQRLRDQNDKLQNQNIIDQMQYFLGPNHNCVYKDKFEQSQHQLGRTEELLLKTRGELQQVIGMVKNYNNDGLMSRILQLDQEIAELKTERSNMNEEIQQLGYQRDEWQGRYQEIQNKLLQMESTQEKLAEAERKMKMQGESIVKINRRLKEKQIEVSDWQKKCNQQNQDSNKKIQRLEREKKELQQRLEVTQGQLQAKEAELDEYSKELQQKNELLDEEKRKSKQLHTELVDMRVNRIAALQDEIGRQKKIIASRVEEIEELEGKIKQNNMKIDLLETQLRNFDDAAEQKLAAKEAEWGKKYKDVEQKYVSTNRDKIALQTQIQEKELLFNQKEQELDLAKDQIIDLKNEINLLTRNNKELNAQIQKLNTEVTARDEAIANLKAKIENFEESTMDLKYKIEEQQTLIEEQTKKIEDQDKTIDSYQSQCQTLHHQIESLKNKIDQFEHELDKEKMNVRAEQQRVSEEKDKNIQSQEQIQKLKEEINQQNDHIKKQEEKIQKVEIKLKKTEDKLQEMQEQDENNHAKVQKELEIKKEELIQEQQKNQELQEENTQQMKELADIKHELSSLQSHHYETQEQLTQTSKKKQEYYESLQKAQQKVEHYKTLEAELQQVQSQIQDSRQKAEELQTVKSQLQNKENEVQQLQKQCNQLQEEQKAQSKKQQEDQQRYQTQIEQLTKSSNSYKKQFKHTQNELSELQQQFEILKEALEGMSDESKRKVASNMAKKKEDTGAHRNSFRQILVDEKTFEQPSDLVDFKFEEIDGSTNLSVILWVRYAQPPSRVVLVSFMREKQRVLEFGIEENNAFATFKYSHRTSPGKTSVITVMSQTVLRRRTYNMVTLMLTEQGSNMDMALNINGMRDDQVSVGSSVFQPDTMLTVGSVEKKPSYSIKDVVLVTQKIQGVALYRQLHQQFNAQYNETKNKPAVEYYSSSDYLVSLVEKAKLPPPHQKQPKKHSRSPNKEQPKQPYSIHKPIQIKGRLIPANLIASCDLLATEPKKPDLKTPPPAEEEVEVQEQQEWSRTRAVSSLIDFFKDKYQLKSAFRPIIQLYSFFSSGLQFISPPFHDEQQPFAFHDHLKALIPKLKIARQPYHLIRMDIFLKFCQLCQINRIDFDNLMEICLVLGIILEHEGHFYIHYDHLLICLRETVVTKAESQLLKRDERKELEKLYAEDQEDEDLSPVATHKPEMRAVFKDWTVNSQMAQDQPVEEAQVVNRNPVRALRVMKSGAIKLVYDADVADFFVRKSEAKEEEKKEEQEKLNEEKEKNENENEKKENENENEKNEKNEKEKENENENEKNEKNENEANANEKAGDEIKEVQQEPQEQDEVEQEIQMHDLQKIKFIFNEDSLMKMIIISKDDQEHLISLQPINEEMQITLQALPLADCTIFSLRAEGPSVTCRTVQYRLEQVQEEFKQDTQRQETDQDFEEDIEMLQLFPLKEGWNQGRFVIHLNRCRNCERHEHTTRHKEQVSTAPPRLQGFHRQVAAGAEPTQGVLPQR